MSGDEATPRGVWGPLADRYEVERPRKLLTIDGGGYRGVLALEILARLEELLSDRLGRGAPYRLCDFFDYVGGTSTGAIIAAGLARGMAVSEIQTLYRVIGPQMFEKARLLDRLKYSYGSEPLARQLQQSFGESTDLSPEHLRCLLLVVTHNASTDSPWPISSNPLAKYNRPDSPDCNLRIPLWQLLRASSAAPTFFPPEVLQWDPQDPSKRFVFDDGAMTPYYNPAFLIYRMATQSPFKLGWVTGEDKLLLISVGTGKAANLQSDDSLTTENKLSNAIRITNALVYHAQVDQDILCRTVGRCVHGDAVDDEIGDLVPRDENSEVLPLSQNQGRAFVYARYDADLSARGLRELGLDDIEPENVQLLDTYKYADELSRIGAAIADEVRLEDFGNFVEPQ